MPKFNTAKFKEKGKALAMTVGEIGVVGGSMLLTKKFLDFNTLWKKSIEKDPAFASKWWMRHQGGLKLGVGVIASLFIKNPWLRLIAIGFALCGFIEEVRIISTDSTGVSFFDAIGKGTRGKSTISDEALYNAAIKLQGKNPTTEYPTYVGENPTNKYPTYVGTGWNMQTDLMPSYATSVGWGG